MFDTLNDAVGGLDIDRFATAMNNLLPTFNSYFWETNCAGVDAFAQNNWLQLKNYCNPPLSQVARLVKFLRDFEPYTPRCVVIAPLWRQQPWFQQLKALATTYILLPHSPHLFTKLSTSEQRTHYLSNQDWRMCAFFINFKLENSLHFPTLSPPGSG